MNEPVMAPVPLPDDGGGGGGEINESSLELALWTRLSLEDVKGLYDDLAGRHAGLVPSKAVLGQLADFHEIEDMRVRQIAALCHAADQEGLLSEYYRSVVGHEYAQGRAGEDVVHIVGVLGAPKAQVEVAKRAREVIGVRALGILDRMMRAVGFVEAVDANGKRDVIGTALLVRRDVVITCAHVAFAPAWQGGRIATGPPLRGALRIGFPETPVGLQSTGVATDAPILLHSEAHMLTIDTLNPVVTDEELKRLDFALLSLDRPIDRVEPISLAGMDVKPGHDRFFLIGFPGRKSAVYDAHEIVRSEAAGGRVIHMIESMRGMSGGCVLSETGVPCGLHEGSIAIREGVRKENRAVLLKPIGEQIARDLPALFKTKPTGVVMQDDALVTRLGRRGAQLLANRAAEAKWEALLRAILRPLETGPWMAHPWFSDKARERIEKWFFDTSTNMETKSRVAFINGKRGCGKTFMIDVLQRVVPDASADIIRVAWTEKDTTLDALARRLALSRGADGTRTADGHDRYESVPRIVRALSRHGMPPNAAGQRRQPLFIAIDAGDETGSVTEPENWIELVAALSRQSWARVVLCGLPPELKRKVEDAVPAEIGCQPFQVDHVRGKEIVAFLNRFGMAEDAAGTAQAAEAAFDSADMPHWQRPELTTVVAALFAIGWQRGILPFPEDD